MLVATQSNLNLGNRDTSKPHATRESKKQFALKNCVSLRTLHWKFLICISDLKIFIHFQQCWLVFVLKPSASGLFCLWLKSSKTKASTIKNKINFYYFHILKNILLCHSRERFLCEQAKFPFHHNLNSSLVKIFQCGSVLLRVCLLYPLQRGPWSTKMTFNSWS